MKREEKNQQMRQRIMDSALMEFSKQGYGGSSINTICAAQNISKGIVYMESVTCPAYPVIDEIKAQMMKNGAVNAMMSSYEPWH